jgi:ATP-binding cassette subfamily B (MDR/TAP) protein 1
MLWRAMLQAGAVAQQAVSQMRTVAAYNGEQRALSEYEQHLDLPVKVRGRL